MNKLTIGLIAAGMINFMIIGWALSGKIEVQEWRTHNENLVHILTRLNEIRDAQKYENKRLDWYMDIIEKIERNTKRDSKEPSPKAPPDDKDHRKLIALADKLILTANGLSSVQDDFGLDSANEYAPLAEFVIKQLKDKP